MTTLVRSIATPNNYRLAALLPSGFVRGALSFRPRYKHCAIQQSEAVREELYMLLQTSEMLSARSIA